MIVALAWSDEFSAKLVDGNRHEVAVGGELDLARIATGIVGAPKAGVKYANESKTSLSVQDSRVHWGYRAVPLKMTDSGRLEIDWQGRVLILNSVARKEKRES